MEKMNTLKKPLLKVLILIIVFGLITSSIFIFSFGKIDSYITNIGVVATPTKFAQRFYCDIISIDIFEYWVFKLTNDEEKIILDDIEKGNWSELSNNHVQKLEYFDHYQKIFRNDYKNHNCYICIYDKKQDKIITNSDKDICFDTTKWIVFLYDLETNHYYCIHETM